MTLHVTSFPYALQTQHTLISPYNEIHWPISYSNVSACRAAVCGGVAGMLKVRDTSSVEAVASWEGVGSSSLDLLSGLGLELKPL